MPMGQDSSRFLMCLGDFWALATGLLLGVGSGCSPLLDACDLSVTTDCPTYEVVEGCVIDEMLIAPGAKDIRIADGIDGAGDPDIHLLEYEGRHVRARAWRGPGGEGVAEIRVIGNRCPYSNDEDFAELLVVGHTRRSERAATRELAAVHPEAGTSRHPAGLTPIYDLVSPGGSVSIHWYLRDVDRADVEAVAPGDLEVTAMALADMGHLELECVFEMRGSESTRLLRPGRCTTIFDAISPGSTWIIFQLGQLSSMEVVRIEQLGEFLGGGRKPDYLVSSAQGGVGGVLEFVEWTDDGEFTFRRTCCGVTELRRFDLSDGRETRIDSWTIRPEGR